jgi:hypothetical protein
MKTNLVPPALFVIGLVVTTSVILLVLRPPELRGHVRAFGKPLANASISTGRIQGIVTDENGDFTIPASSGQLQRGLWFAVWPPYGLEQTHTVEFSYPGQVVHMDIDLGSAGLGGVVRNAATQAPLPGSYVRLSAEGCSPVVKTDDEGRFFIGPIPPQVYEMEVEATGFDVLKRNLDLRDGLLQEHVSLDLAAAARAR